jgi:hypothetical protein
MAEGSEQKGESRRPSLVDNFSLVIGGPSYKALRRMKLVEPAPNIRGRTLTLLEY